MRWIVACLGIVGLASAAAAYDPGEVGLFQKISDTEGGLVGALADGDEFGFDAASIGDLDGDGVTDLAIGADRDNDGGSNRGAVWILFLNTDGTVKDEQKISDTAGGFSGSLQNGDRFGAAVALLGDLDGDGTDDLAVGSHTDDDGGTDRGSLWILFMNSDGTVDSEQKISDTQGGFSGVLDNSDFFGLGLSALGDLDGDGTLELAVGALGDDDGTADAGAVWILSIDSSGMVTDEQKISATTGGFGGVLGDDRFGVAVAALGDLDGDGVADLAVGADLDDDGGSNTGAVWILFLNDDGTVASEQKISDTEGGFIGPVSDGDGFGYGVTNVGDLDGDGISDIGVGARFEDLGDTNAGAAWILFLDTDGTVQDYQEIAPGRGFFNGTLDASDFFGTGIARLGDLDGDGRDDLAVTAYTDDDGGTDRGAVWVLFLRPTVTISLEWEDSGSSDLVIKPNDPSAPTPSCTGAPAVGRCAAVVMTNIEAMAVAGMSVWWNDSNGLEAIDAVSETFAIPGGTWTSFPPFIFATSAPECAGMGCTDYITSIIGAAIPGGSVFLPPGTYTIGHVRWDTSSVTDSTEVHFFERPGFDAFEADVGFVSSDLQTGTLTVSTAIPAVTPLGGLALVGGLLALGTRRLRRR